MTTYTDRFVTDTPSRQVFERFRGIARRQGWVVQQERLVAGSRREMLCRSRDHELIELVLTPARPAGTAVELVVVDERADL